ncbi:hypothetical protein FOZ61_008849, partial [Perkinsus olseni]
VSTALLYLLIFTASPKTPTAAFIILIQQREDITQPQEEVAAGSSSCSSSVQATANVRLHEPVSAVYGAYRQYDGSSGNSYTYTSQTAFKATTGAMRSTAVILLMGTYSEELCLSAKQAILMVPGVLAVTTQQVTWARKQKAYATVSLVRGLNSAMQNALLRTLEEAGIQGLVIAEDTLKELIISSANDGSSSSRNQDQQQGEDDHHEAVTVIEAAATIPEGTVSAAVASRQAAMREYSVSTDSVVSGTRRRSLAESHARKSEMAVLIMGNFLRVSVLGQESPEGGVERAKEALQLELPHLQSGSSAPTVTSIDHDSDKSRSLSSRSDKENDVSGNSSAIPEIDRAKVEPSPTLPSYDCQWVPLADLPLRDRLGSSGRRRKGSGDASPSSPAYIDNEDRAKDAVGRWLSDSPDRCSDGDKSITHRRGSFDSSLSDDDEDDDGAYLDEYGDPTKQNSNAQMQFFNQAAMSFGYTRALGMHEKFAGVVTLHTGEEQPSATAAESESSSKGEENAPDSKHYYGGSWFGGWLGNN